MKQSGVGMRYLDIVIAVASLQCVALQCGVAAEVVLVRTAESDPQTRQLAIAAQFYGLNLVEAVPSGSANEDRAILHAIGREGTVAVAIAANALGAIDRKFLLGGIAARRGGSVPVLILGVTPRTDPAQLKAWSNGAVVGCVRAPGPENRRYRFLRAGEMAQPLSGLELPFTGTEAFRLVPGENSELKHITAIRAEGQDLPVFVEVSRRGPQVFLATAPPVMSTVSEWTVDSLMAAFVEVAPEMISIRHFAGERAWHSLHPYANFTIDDPWLRESYGHLRYKDLLAEMVRHNFHSTVAFIPWNYDRSEPEVASLFRENPDRFSVCIHGDNHDHKEFRDYRSKPLANQMHSIRQALLRMDQFRSRTGVSFDRVMVFPHSIAPENTLAALKAYDFLGTINSSNVPMDRSTPSLLPFALRPITMSFGNFQSIRRYPAEVGASDAFVAMNQFLDNPLFFYGHQDFFANGADAFNQVADRVNRLQPNTRWRSTGEILKHSYLIRLREDRNYDVTAFSSEFSLDNNTARSAQYFIEKPENGVPSLSSVTVNGDRVDYSHRDGKLVFRVPVPHGESRAVVIQYDAGPQAAAVSAAKDSPYIYVVRMASDFRDIGMSRYALGRRLIRLYSVELGTPIGALILLLALAGVGAVVAHRRKKQRLTAAPYVH